MFKEYFIERQELLLNDKHIENVLRLVPEDLRQTALESWKGSNDSSPKRWADLEASVTQVRIREGERGSRKQKN
jgi:hypothetical protein